jgi:hypothetical protein|tara:strand:- start:667 stop:813 length:147 start_codon:yes stop_codon:yes gene_type:complete
MTDTPEKKGKKLTMSEMKNDDAQKSKEGIMKHISKQELNLKPHERKIG